MTKPTDPNYDIYSDPVFELKYELKRQREGARELRAKILRMVEAGESQAGLARKLGMNTSTMYVWIARARKERAGIAVDDQSDAE